MLNKTKSKDKQYLKLILLFESSYCKEPSNRKVIGLCLGKAVVAVSESQFTLKRV